VRLSGHGNRIHARRQGWSDDYIQIWVGQSHQGTS
jgi:hypothetical protein